MPAWWKGKLKSKPKPASSPHAEPAGAAATPPPSPPRTKASSFEDSPISRKKIGGRGIGSAPALAPLGHPLPRPSPTSSPLPSTPHEHPAAAASASGSASASVSSSGSSDDAPDLGCYRYSDQINMTRGRNASSNPQRHRGVGEEKHPRYSETMVSPRKEFQSNCLDPSTSGATAPHRRSSTEIFAARTTSSSPSSTRHQFSTSPVHQTAFSLCPGSPTGRHDNMRSSPHPLPLPPMSPGSSSHSLQSQWKKGKMLGRGTFGNVYLGFHSEGGKMCAIKEVKVISDDSNSKECLKQLNQEIALLSQLSHPNIVQYYGSELADETLSVYLEYVSAGSIHKLLQEYGPFKEPVIRNYTSQILSGLAYLHGRNTVHRDIKGANILVDPNGEIKLADFGMAKHISAYTSIRSFKGSPYWMAPEVIMNANGYNLSVDIWSLGCTVLEMATSKPPWSQYEGVAAIFKIGNSKDLPEIPDHLSGDAKNFLNLCLHRDPAARLTAAQLMDHPFVRDQATPKGTRFNVIRDIAPPSMDRDHVLTPMEFSLNRSTSPLRDTGIGARHLAGFPFNDLVSTRANMSLPVSPCSSPLRQFRQSNWSRLPSPPHPAYSAGAINYSPINSTLYPSRPTSTFSEPWLEISQLKVQNPYDSPRRL